MQCALVKFDIKHGFQSSIFTMLFTSKQKQAIRTNFQV